MTAGLGLGAPIFTSALVLAMAYTFAQDNRGRKVHFIIFKIPAQYLPFAMLAASLVMGGPGAALREGTGLIAAHLYDFLTRIYPTFQGGRNWIQTPRVIREAFGSDRPSWNHRPYGTSYRPGEQRQTTQQASSTGWTSALGSSWGSRGAGRRLGGD